MLMPGSTTRLFVNLIFSVLLIIIYATLAINDPGFMVFASALIVLPLSIHSIVLAFQLIDAPGPVLSVGPRGLVFNSKITPNDLLYWDQIEKFSHSTIHYGLVYLPWMSYLIIRTSEQGFFKGISRLLPTTWFGVYLVPTRFLKGGSKGAKQLLRMLDQLREADRHESVHQETFELVKATDFRWAMLRNLEFPVDPKMEISKTLMVSATEDAVLAQLSIDRDELPQFHDQFRNSPSIKGLLEQARNAVPDHASSRPSFGKKVTGATLNGKPL